MSSDRGGGVVREYTSHMVIDSGGGQYNGGNKGNKERGSWFEGQYNEILLMEAQSEELQSMPPPDVTEIISNSVDHGDEGD